MRREIEFVFGDPFYMSDRKKGSGRPRKDFDEKISDLKEHLRNGVSIKMGCAEVKLRYQSLYARMIADKDLKDEIDAARAAGGHKILTHALGDKKAAMSYFLSVYNHLLKADLMIDDDLKKIMLSKKSTAQDKINAVSDAYLNGKIDHEELEKLVKLIKLKHPDETSTTLDVRLAKVSIPDNSKLNDKS